jgi:hypothetical protein
VGDALLGGTFGAVAALTPFLAPKVVIPGGGVGWGYGLAILHRVVGPDGPLFSPVIAATTVRALGFGVRKAVVGGRPKVEGRQNPLIASAFTVPLTGKAFGGAK